jgi:hypothetical protein
MLGHHKAQPKVKVEVMEVKVDLKYEPPSPPRGQPTTHRASKRAMIEATPPPPPPSPPPLEPLRAVFTVPLMYRHPDDGEWAGYNIVVHLLVAEAGIVIIDNEEDDDGGASTDAKGEAHL